MEGFFLEVIKNYKDVWDELKTTFGTAQESLFAASIDN
jgi:hypothetical protein